MLQMITSVTASPEAFYAAVGATLAILSGRHWC
jgi:hypothetical protein